MQITLWIETNWKVFVSQRGPSKGREKPLKGPIAASDATFFSLSVLFCRRIKNIISLYIYISMRMRSETKKNDIKEKNQQNQHQQQQQTQSHRARGNNNVTFSKNNHDNKKSGYTPRQNTIFFNF